MTPVINWDLQPLGRAPDGDIASKLGVSREAVRKARVRRKVAAWAIGNRLINWSAVPIGVDSDCSIAKLIGVPKSTVSRARRRQSITRVGHRNGLIYFFRCGDWIKIGWTSRSPLRRLREIQAYCPFVVVLVGTIPGKAEVDEQALHERFACHRGGGEWFQASEELLEYIAGAVTQ